MSSCPGAIQCSGHGVCSKSPYFQCNCDAGWTNGDCSLRTCPMGHTWFGYPNANEVGHQTLTPCSNQGLCNSATGTCSCRLPFYGAACEYLACGGGVNVPYCNGHGRCMTMYEMSLWATNNGDAVPWTYGLNPNNPLTWDGGMIKGCVCDEGWHNYDCTLRTCPAGDDPGTYNDHNEVQLLQCVADGGYVTLTFRQQTTIHIPYDATAVELKAMLESLSTLGPLRVYYSRDPQPVPPNGTLNYVKPVLPRGTEGMPTWGFFNANNTFEFTSPPEGLSFTSSGFCDPNGAQVAIIVFDTIHGSLPALIPGPPVSALSNSLTGLVAGIVNVFTGGESVGGMASIKGTTETATCNNRGICNVVTGRCACFPTWSSSDGNGGPGDLGDCGYRNDMINGFHDSIKNF